MKNKGEKTYKILEILSDLEVKSKFTSAVSEIRKEYKIPHSGFSDIPSGLFFEEDGNAGFGKKIRELREIFDLPVFFSSFLSNYVLYGHNFPDFFFDNKELCEIDIFSPLYPSPIDKCWSDSGTPFVRLYISDLASKQDVIDFIDKNWTPEIKRILDEQRGKPKKRVRRKSKRDIHFAIGSLYSMPIKVLKNMAPKKTHGGGYVREKIIQDIINIKFEEDFSIFSIRKLGTDYKKKKYST